MLDQERSFEDLIAEVLEKSRSAKGAEIDDATYHIGEIIYDKFLWCLEKLLHNKYGRFLREIDLETSWRYEFRGRGEHPLKSEKLWFGIYYAVDEDGFSEYEPLVKFVFSLDEGKLDEVYAKRLFKRMDRTLEKCLKTTYVNWVSSMVEYHGYLLGHFGKRISMDNPRDNPEKFFLTHEVVVLN